MSDYKNIKYILNIMILFKVLMLIIIYSFYLSFLRFFYIIKQRKVKSINFNI